MPAVSDVTTGSDQGAACRVVVTVGTDHHPFDRLISWVNDYLGAHPEQIGGFFAQSGPTAVVPVCASSPFLEADRLDEVLGQADLMICHGGPGSIADAWQRGHVPVVVPRLRRLGEVVDDHQVDFCAKLAGLGRVRVAEDGAALAALLDEAAADLTGFRVGDTGTDAGTGVDEAVRRFGDLVDQLLSAPRRRRPFSRSTSARGGRVVGAGTRPAVVIPAREAVPEQQPAWHASREPAHVGLGGVPEEEQE